MDQWQPISLVELESLVANELEDCSPKLKELFAQTRIPFVQAPINRYGNLESVFIVAKRGTEVLYYEDVEEGFNFSPLSPEGLVLEHWCNQDPLKFALLHWAT